ncbi:hypothetical protein [Shimia sp. R9_3]|uniref:hypothetical protein n=1 Tax=Shimia sp. R9_3 TaxID=2821113 RepID=UPI001ADBA9C4|nr:hypothetical protein [Shimia sp. R9_3]MBO9401106.1 hypothetical protein [Shimia sp. R9_3]
MLRQKVILSMALIAVAQTASAMDRPSAAVRLFEDVCLPIVYETLPPVLKETKGQEEFSEGVLKSTKWYWPHLPSGFSVEVTDYPGGLIKCEITDKGQVLSPAERQAFEKQVVGWMGSRMPMLAQETPEPIESFEYFNSWMTPQFDRNDLRRWGVLHLRFSAEFDHTTSLILAYLRKRPTS